jgi:retinol-binding protein 3
MTNNINFSYQDKSYDISLKQIVESSDKTVTVDGRAYQVLGSEEAVVFFKSQVEKIGTTDFENFDSLEVSLKQIGKQEGSKQEKIDSVFQKTIDISTEKTNSITIEEKNPLKIDIPRTIKEIGEKLEQYYVFPDIGKKCSEYLRLQLEKGAYEKISDPKTFVDTLTKDLREISHDGHIRVCLPYVKPPSPPSIEELNGPYSLPDLNDPIVKFKSKLNKEDSYPYEFRSGLLKEDSTVGYIDIRDLLNCKYLGDKPTGGQNYQVMIDFDKRKKQLIAAANNLKGAERIIIDLRNCGGGHSTGVQLMSSLFVDKESPLTRVEWREGDGITFTDVNTLTNEELPQNQRLLNKTVIILTGPKTFSAAEAFINDMRVLEKAITVGEPSGGGANSGKEWYQIGGFDVYIPEGEAIHPQQKERGERNWEGVGIIPDHQVSAEDALKTAISI